MKKLSDAERIERYWSYVQKGNDQDCWLWTRKVGYRRYGQFAWHDGKPRGVHRIALELNIGGPINETYVHHQCENKLCCNPNHLIASDSKSWPPKEPAEPKIRQTYEQRFWSRVKTGCPTDCWPWTGKSTVGGYGMWYRKDNHQRTTAARIAWELERGPLDEIFQVKHSCKNSACVNPDHLEAE